MIPDLLAALDMALAKPAKAGIGQPWTVESTPLSRGNMLNANALDGLGQFGQARGRPEAEVPDAGGSGDVEAKASSGRTEVSGRASPLYAMNAVQSVQPCANLGLPAGSDWTGAPFELSKAVQRRAKGLLARITAGEPPDGDVIAEALAGWPPFEKAAGDTMFDFSLGEAQVRRCVLDRLVGWWKSSNRPEGCTSESCAFCGEQIRSAGSHIAVVDGDAWIHYGGTAGAVCWTGWCNRRTQQALLGVLSIAAGEGSKSDHAVLEQLPLFDRPVPC